jgi:hypothetical protein
MPLGSFAPFLEFSAQLEFFLNFPKVIELHDLNRNMPPSAPPKPHLIPPKPHLTPPKPHLTPTKPHLHPSKPHLNPSKPHLTPKHLHKPSLEPEFINTSWELSLSLDSTDSKSVWYHIVALIPNVGSVQPLDAKE